MAGPGDLAGDGWMRVSHADRDQVVATLQHGMARPFMFLAMVFVITAFGVLATGAASSAEQRSDRRRAAAGLPPRSAGPR